MKTAFVAAGMQTPENKNMLNDAFNVGRILAENNFLMLQGGHDKGLMGISLKSFLSLSKNVKFLIPNIHFKRESDALKKLTGEKDFNCLVVEGESGRLEHMRKLSKIVVILPGGSGTLLELLYANEIKRYKDFKGEIYLINTDGFFNNVIAQINHNIKMGFQKECQWVIKVLNNSSEFEAEIKNFK